MRDRLMTMLQRFLIVLVLLVAACDSPPTVPTTPSTPPPAATPLPDPPALVRLKGSVTDERGMPIAGASVGAFTNAGRVSTVTDVRGSYELSGAFDARYGVVLGATQEGYEPNYQFVPASAAVQNFRLRDIVRIAIGESRTVRVDADDTLYGSSEQYRARQVRVVAQATGNLVVDGSSSNAERPVWLSARDFEDFPCCPPQLVVKVSTGQEVTVHVLTYWLDVPAAFSVTTRLEPQ